MGGDRSLVRRKAEVKEGNDKETLRGEKLQWSKSEGEGRFQSTKARNGNKAADTAAGHISFRKKSNRAAGVVKQASHALIYKRQMHFAFFRDVSHKMKAEYAAAHILSASCKKLASVIDIPEQGGRGAVLTPAVRPTVANACIERTHHNRGTLVSIIS